jgi:hypothetical protein
LKRRLDGGGEAVGVRGAAGCVRCYRDCGVEWFRVDERGCEGKRVRRERGVSSGLSRARLKRPEVGQCSHLLKSSIPCLCKQHPHIFQSLYTLQLQIIVLGGHSVTMRIQVAFPEI